MAEDGKHLRHGAAPGLPDFYNQAVNGLVIGDGMGACGTAAYRGERVIVEDVQQHAYWPGPYRDLARQAGVQSCWSQPIKDSNGRVLGTFAIYHQKPARPSDTEIALIERYADLAALVIERIRIQDDLRLKDLALDAAANAVVITDKNARIKWVNQAFSKLTGYDLSEAIGRPPKELVKSGKQSQSYYEALWQTILSGEVWHGELINRRKDGSLYHEEMTITPVVNEQGEITHFVAVKQDITERKQNEELLRESEEQFRQLSENISEVFWMTELAKNKMLYISPAYEQTWGRTVQSLYDSPRDWLEAIHGEDRQRVLQAALTKQAAGLYNEEYRIVRPNGDVRWIHDRAFPVRDSGGAVYRIVGVAEDITERKQVEQALAESESRFREIFNTVSDAILIHDAETGRIIDVNHRMCEMYGLTHKEALACGPDDLSAGTPPYSSAEAIEKIRLARTEGPQTFDWLARARDGHLFWVEVSLRFALISSQQRILAMVRDISERKQAEEKIYQLAFYDLLTGLPNRRLLNDRLGQTLAASKRSDRYGALMFMDLDNFKPLNDTYGHGVGDLLLMEVARRISSCVREVDTVARFGGDEFVVILSELDADRTESLAQASIVAEKIRAILAEPYVLAVQQEGKAGTITVEHHCTSSIGVVLFISYESSAENILKWADMAMYQAKEAGRNLILFYDSKA